MERSDEESDMVSPQVYIGGNPRHIQEGMYVNKMEDSMLNRAYSRGKDMVSFPSLFAFFKVMCILFLGIAIGYEVRLNMLFAEPEPEPTIWERIFCFFFKRPYFRSSL